MFVHSQSTLDFREENRQTDFKELKIVRKLSAVNAYYSAHSPTHSDWPSDMEVVKKMSKSCQKLSSVATVGRVAL